MRAGGPQVIDVFLFILHVAVHKLQSVPTAADAVMPRPTLIFTERYDRVLRSAQPLQQAIKFGGERLQFEKSQGLTPQHTLLPQISCPYCTTPHDVAL